MTRWSKVLSTQDDAERLDAGWHRVRARRTRPRMARRVVVVAPLLALAALIFVLVRGWAAPAVPLASAPPAASAAHAAPAAPAASALSTMPALAAATGAATSSSGAKLAPALPPARIASLALEGGAPIPTEWSASAPRVVTFDDASRLELVPGARVKHGDGAAERVELGLERGRVTFDITPNGPRAWVIEAGAVVVKVLGTRFTVSRSGNAVDVTVERGKVQVEAPQGIQILTAGQSFSSAAAQGERAAVTGAAKLSPAADVPAVAASVAVSATAPAGAGSALVTPAAAVAPDAMSRADALRRSGNAVGAAAVLREVIEAGDRRAPLAAFTLGKIHVEDLRDPAGAAPWFERALALGLPSGLDEEALARAVECFRAAGAGGEAKRAAKRYEARFPEGRHLAQVKEWSRD